MEFTAQQIAEYLNGTIQGDSSVKVSNFAKIEDGIPGTLSFLSNPKYYHFIYESKASIVLVNKNLVLEKSVTPTLIFVDNAYESIARLLSLVEQNTKRKEGISPLAYISHSAVIGKGAYVAPFAYIGDYVVIGNNAGIHAHCTVEDYTTIGDDVQLFSGVKIYKNTVIKNRCTIHAGAIIGADGFGFAPTADGSYKKIPQLGNVLIEDDVEIGANSTIDCATMGSTIIRKGVKIDNLVQVAHNSEIGQNTVIASQTGIAGSTKVGANCMFAGQVGIAGHLQIADGTILGAQAGVPSSIKTPKTAHQGTPAIPVANFRRSSVVYKNLPEIQQIIYQLQKRIDDLEKRLSL